MKYLEYEAVIVVRVPDDVEPPDWLKVQDVVDAATNHLSEAGYLESHGLDIEFIGPQPERPTRDISDQYDDEDSEP